MCATVLCSSEGQVGYTEKVIVRTEHLDQGEGLDNSSCVQKRIHFWGNENGIHELICRVAAEQRMRRGNAHILWDGDED